MKILVVTSCTGEKQEKPSNQLTIRDFRKGAAHIKAREKELSAHALPATKMYTGEQHLRLMRGIDAFRQQAGTKAEVEVWILSAGYGFIPEKKKIAPYECTFATMRSKELTDWSRSLKAPSAFRRILKQKYDLGIILLGENYLDACAIDSDIQLGGPTLLLASTGAAKNIPRIPNLRVATLSNAEAKRFSCGLVGLKGELASRLLGKIANDPAIAPQLADPGHDLLSLLDTNAPKRELVTTRPATRANPNVDRIIDLPEAWWDKPHRTKLRYFIPEWDDLVDPDYDFFNDEHSGGRGDWSNETYAHQMYPEPNYDGILVSRAVADKGKKKSARINALGVHRFLRVPKRFPVMGDCGAFDYIMEEKPPYTTEDVLDYYTRLGFDYGVSVDHLIVTATESQKKFRYQLTIDNAADFIKQHKKARLPWEPIGAVQGWDPDSYAKAAAQYAKMGYKYVALGGLVRTTTREILQIVSRVRTLIPSEIKVHLFGIARPNAIPAMLSAGVNSIDSASHLRRAWLGAGQNYFALDGRTYAAARIPQVGKSFRAKRMVSEGRAKISLIEKLERRCLTLIRSYDAGKAGIKDTLDALCEFDHLVTEGRKDIRPLLEPLLAEKPWKSCPCEICKKDGIEVVIFRGNNRNRRRGFHNTYVFYRLMQDAVNTGKLPGGWRKEDETAQPPLFEQVGAG